MYQNVLRSILFLTSVVLLAVARYCHGQVRSRTFSVLEEQESHKIGQIGIPQGQSFK